MQQIPLTESKWVQDLGHKVEVPSAGSPRSTLQAKSMENTLNLRLFSEKKKHLFNYDVKKSRPIYSKRSFATPVEASTTPTPEVVQKIAPILRVHDILGKAKHKQVINHQITADTLFEPQKSVIKSTAPFKMSDAKQHNIFQNLALKAASTNPEKGFFDSLNIFNASCCQGDPNRPSATSPTFNFGSTPVKTQPDSDPFEHKWTFRQMSSEKKSPPKLSVYKNSKSAAPLTPDPEEVNVHLYNNLNDDGPGNKVSFISGAELRQSLNANARGEFVDLEYYNQKLPSHKRLEVYEGSPNRKIPPFSNSSSMKQSLIRSSSAIPAGHLLNDFERSENNSILSFTPGRDSRRSDLKQNDVLEGDRSVSPIEAKPYQHYLNAGNNSVQKTSIKVPKYEAQSKPTPRQFIADVWAEEFNNKIFKSSRSMEERQFAEGRVSRRLLHDMDDTQVSEIPPVQDTMLKRTIPTEP